MTQGQITLSPGDITYNGKELDDWFSADKGQLHYILKDEFDQALESGGSIILKMYDPETYELLVKFVFNFVPHTPHPRIALAQSTSTSRKRVNVCQVFCARVTTDGHLHSLTTSTTTTLRSKGAAPSANDRLHLRTRQSRIWYA